MIKLLADLVALARNTNDGRSTVNLYLFSDGTIELIQYYLTVTGSGPYDRKNKMRGTISYPLEQLEQAIKELRDAEWETAEFYTMGRDRETLQLKRRIFELEEKIKN